MLRTIGVIPARGAVVLGMLALLPAAQLRAQTPATSGTAATSPTVATVGPLRIQAAELDQQMKVALETFRARKQVDLDPQLEGLVRRQALENLIRQRLLTLDSRKSGVTVTDAEVEAQLKRDPAFQQNGTFSEAKYLALKATNPQVVAAASASIRDMLMARKMSERVDRETRPDEPAIRAQLTRELTQASIEFLPLRRSDFDGNYPEPRETDILAEYRAHADRYRRGEQAVISLILVDKPSLSDSSGASPSAYRAWERRLAARADSALTVLRSGTRPADLAPVHGGIKTGIRFDRAKPPEFWRGSAKQLNALFGTAAGTFMTEPVPVQGGLGLIRLDSVQPPHIAPLREVSAEIRADLRAAAAARRDQAELRVIYDGLKDSLRTTGYRLIYAVADTATYTPGEPTGKDLEQYYRAHLADYSSYDKAAGAIVERPLTAVRDEVRLRWRQEQRREQARRAAERVHDAWSRNKRDAATERAMTRVREVGPIAAGAPVEPGIVGEKLSEALAHRGETGVAMITLPDGYVVYHVREVIQDFVPALDQSTSLLAGQLAEHRAAAEETAARAAFEKDPGPYQIAKTLLFTRIMVERPPVLSVPLTRDEVERFYRTNVGNYSVPELVHVRHILISPEGNAPGADEDARRKAEGILQRLRAGEDFAKLCEQFSDDPATRETGGDLGPFGRGKMREGFEAAAFQMRPGDLAGPVHTEVGYHLIECLDYLPPVIHPLREIYGNVAYDCAMQKGQRMGADRADSLFRRMKTPANARAAAKRLGLEVIPSNHVAGQHMMYQPALRPFIQKLETLKPGQFYPGVVWYEGYGHAIAWVDSILPPRLPTWDEAREQALNGHRRRIQDRALLAKKAELDSMLSAGWSFDSLGTLFGGLERISEAPAGRELRQLGGRAQLDSLVFGGVQPPVLDPGQVSEWVEFPGGFTKMRIAERQPPDPGELERRVTLRRQLVLYRNLSEYFDRLKARYPVQILDSELRATTLPEPTES